MSDWLWANSYKGGTVTSYVSDVQFMSDGGVVVSGHSNSGTTGLLRRYTADGQLDWDLLTSGPSTRFGGVAVTSDGGIVVAGQVSTSGTVVFGSASLSCSALTLIMSKVSSTGSVEWLKSGATSAFFLSPYSCVVDSSDNAFAVGYHQGAITQGTTSISGRGHYAAKFTSAGSASWIAGSTGYSTGDMVAAAVADGADGLWMAGSGRTSGAFGTVTLTGTIFSFLARIDSSGSFTSVFNTDGTATNPQTYSVTTYGTAVIISGRESALGGYLAAFGGTAEMWRQSISGAYPSAVDCDGTAAAVFGGSNSTSTFGSAGSATYVGPNAVGWFVPFDPSTGTFTAVHAVQQTLADTVSPPSHSASGRVSGGAAVWGAPFDSSSSITFGTTAALTASATSFAVGYWGSLAPPTIVATFLRQRQSPRGAPARVRPVALRQRQSPT